MTALDLRRAKSDFIGMCHALVPDWATSSYFWAAETGAACKTGAAERCNLDVETLVEGRKSMSGDGRRHTSKDTIQSRLE